MSEVTTIAPIRCCSTVTKTCSNSLERSFVPKRRSRRTDYRKETMMTKKEVLLLKRCARAQFWPASYLKRGSRVDRALVAGGYLKIVQTDGHRFVRIRGKGRDALAAAEIQ